MAVVDRGRVAAALPGYTIGSELGAGAFGLVLAAHHQELDRRVAVKVLANAEPRAAVDFRTEARVLSRLDHPHIVRTYDYVARGDVCLLVMELLGGGSLADRRLRPETSCAVVLALADALAAAHGQGALHRDIKPANVLFTENGQPKLADFGISKVIEGSASTASRVVGTPRYMAPEQITGGRLSPATDLYALAAVLYELLSGSPVVPGQVSLPVLLRHHLEVVPPPPPGVPGPLADMVMRSLAKRPEDRHPDARAFAVDLARAATRVFGRGWVEACGAPIRIADDLRALTTSRLSGLTGAGGAGGDGRVRRRPLAWAGVGATAVLLVLTLALGVAAGGGVGWALWHPEPAAPTLQPPAWQPASLPLGTIISIFGVEGLDISGDGGSATFAVFDSLGGFALDLPRGYMYLADYFNHRVRRVDRDGIVTTVAGNGIAGFSGDGGPATRAQLQAPSDIAVAGDGSLYIADSSNNRVRRVDTHGIITTVAGTGEAGYDGPVGDDGLTFSGDGVPATKAMLRTPAGLALDGQGNLYISDESNERVRRVGTDGVITTVAGSGVADGGDGDGPATRAFFRAPQSLAFGPDGSLYVVDGGNNRIRRVTPDGMITTVVGTGKAGYSGDGGPATEAQIDPSGAAIVVDSAGALYFSDRSRIRRVDASGVVTTIVGTGESDLTGDGGPAVDAQIRQVYGLALDESQGILYLFDGGADRMRAVRVAQPPCTDPPCPSPAVPSTARPAPGPSPSPVTTSTPPASTPMVPSPTPSPTPPVAASVART
ncbi:protein kinase [Frankia sp. Mgl5]|uniref:protein kinase domain-containing protein n=1 Tax=Frankia sp. Mgl5 TaxID=2933793 RepID=UPI00200EA2A4|nr:protein kinase [Frankia sp. Mgl5]MCK9929380.1 protein kinase [Frankia sp. Mgl5]